jgi:uncharacterized repeat protein (TIGR03803 family)
MSRLRLVTLASLFVIAAVASLHAQFSVLYNFNPAASGNLNGVLAQGLDGDIYGTNTYPAGVLKITPTGSPVLLNKNLYLPFGMTLGTDGNFYGTALDSGSVPCGTVPCGLLFKMTPGGTLTVLHNFTGGADGAAPYYPPVQGPDGNFYGTTSLGGNPKACDISPPAPGAGTVYKVTPSGTFTTIHQFDSFDGCSPRGPLTLGTDGNLYGTTYSGGSLGAGEVFKVNTAGKVTVVVSLNGADGQNPIGPIVQASDGNFYGTTYSGGSSFIGYGVVFKVTPGGALTVLHNFMGAPDGAYPSFGLTQATDGDLYGTTAQGGTCASGVGCGTIFRVTLSGAYSIVHNFDGAAGGGNPSTAVFQHTKGALYGATAGGGSHSSGVVYSFGLPSVPFIAPLTASGKPGQTVEILGQALTGTTKVDFGTGAATFTVVSGTNLTAVVPATGTTGNISAVTPSGTLVSNKVFRVIPTIASVSPANGPVGSAVVIAGAGLTQTTRVTFGGVKATAFTVKSATQVTTTVPNGARTGSVVITTPGGTGAGPKAFRVTPVIKGFSPASGKVGTSVTITGTSFTSATSVTFGGATATFTVNSDSQVTATVPTNGVTGKIGITTPGGTATSSSNFTVTP